MAKRRSGFFCYFSGCKDPYCENRRIDPGAKLAQRGYFICNYDGITVPGYRKKVHRNGGEPRHSSTPPSVKLQDRQLSSDVAELGPLVVERFYRRLEETLQIRESGYLRN